MPIRFGEINWQVQVGSSGGVISITGNTLESTDTSSSPWNKGSGIYFYVPSSQRWAR